MQLIAPSKNERGFTMVEMMVVVLIIGVLAAIAIPLYLNQRKAAQEAALRSDLADGPHPQTLPGLQQRAGQERHLQQPQPPGPS